MAAPVVPPGWPRLSGGVFVEPAAVAPLARLLEGERRRQLSVNGAQLTAPLARLLVALIEEAKSQPLPTVTWMSSAAAAKVLGCTSQAVRNMIADERLVGRLEGRSWLVEKASVDSQASLLTLPGKARKARSDGVRKVSQSSGRAESS